MFYLIDCLDEESTLQICLDNMNVFSGATINLTVLMGRWGM